MSAYLIEVGVDHGWSRVSATKYTSTKLHLLPLPTVVSLSKLTHD
jgi:hypothetical protein